jgi:hypothetical protein
MNTRFLQKYLLATWIAALAILGILALDSSAELHTQYPFMDAFPFNRDTINAPAYTSKNTPPISLGAIKNNSDAYIQLKLRFRADNTEGHPNVFQTAPVNSGIRMEISGPTATLIFPDTLEPGGLKGLALTSALKTGQWYELEVDALNGAYVRAKLDGLNIADYMSEGFSMETSQLLAGGGFDETRAFRGQIENISVTKGNLPGREFQRVFYQVLLLGLIVLLIKFWKQLLLEIPRKAKIAREYLLRLDYSVVISLALIGIFGVTLLTAYYFPLYSDEIDERFWLSRLPYDFPERMSLFPRCISNYFQPMPFTMYLPALIDWAVHGTIESPTSLRQIGVVVALIWVSGLTYYLYIKAKNTVLLRAEQLSAHLQGLTITGFMIAIFSIGVFPIFLVINRPEQLILPAATLLVTIFLLSNYTITKGRWWQKIGLTILFFVAISLAIFEHPKGLLLTPVFVIVGWKLFSHFKSRIPLFLGMILLGTQVFQAFIAWKFSFQCGEFPEFEGFMKSFSFDPFSLFYDPLSFFDQSYHSLMRFPEYLEKLGFQEFSETSYLPNQPLAISTKIINLFLQLNVVIAFFFLLVILPYQYYRRDIVNGRFVTVNLVLLALFVCTLISGIINLPKHWYDAGYLFGLMLIILVFFLGENFTDKFRETLTRKIFFYLGTLALLSQVIFIDRNLPAFMAGYSGPGIPIGKYESEKLHDDLVAASQACDIDPIHSKGVVVDDYAYGYFQKSKWPMSYTYIWLNNDTDSIRQVFSKLDSDGLVAYCSAATDRFKPYVIKTGHICCIPKNQLSNALSLP